MFPLVLALPVGGKDPDGTEGPGLQQADRPVLWKASIRNGPDTEPVQFFMNLVCYDKTFPLKLRNHPSLQRR